ncbi:nuclease A inhibitor family protein [Chamaesiphon sp.]|uniref:nuclease A inhibitor family protein n=1 Tax=Chamaesiphon sp. TaxID=2814140 RepID=UPI0035938AE8
MVYPLSAEIVTTAEIIDRLQQATVNLLWSSESDYPFEVVTWQQGVEITPIALFGVDRLSQSIETIALSDFFAPVLTVEDWYDTSELKQVERYTELLHAIESHLAEIQVFRVGEVEIAIYIVGKTPNGDLVGLKTQAIET